MSSEHPRTENDPADEAGEAVDSGGTEVEAASSEPLSGQELKPDAAGEDPARGADGTPHNAADEPPPPPAPRRKGGFLSFLALLLALAALLGTAWMWWQDLGSATDLEERIFSEIARLESSDSELSLKLRQVREEVGAIPTTDQGARVDELERRLSSDLAVLEGLEQSVEEQLAVSRSLRMAGESLQRRLDAAESALAGMATGSLDAGGELDLAEVDYLLRLANERLKLFHDPVAADETLDLADRHLAALDDPVFLAVRQDIAAARRQIESLDLPDYFAIGNELDAIQDAVTTLPFRNGATPAPEAAAEEPDGWWEKLKGVFSGLVTVRRSTEHEEQRISLEDKDYVRQRLWLQLEVAHLALMRRDGDAFRESLLRVQQTMGDWFDPDAAAYRSVEDRLEALGQETIEAEMPDISQPWATLRQVRALRSLPAPAEPAAEVAPAGPSDASDGDTGG